MHYRAYLVNLLRKFLWLIPICISLNVLILAPACTLLPVVSDTDLCRIVRTPYGWGSGINVTTTESVKKLSPAMITDVHKLLAALEDLAGVLDQRSFERGDQARLGAQLGFMVGLRAQPARMKFTSIRLKCPQPQSAHLKALETNSQILHTFASTSQTPNRAAFREVLHGLSSGCKRMRELMVDPADTKPEISPTTYLSVAVYLSSTR
ncbi:hypothetical protein R3P38DRAFT_3194811 [Favolaschia claudopus]|uniref:Uncharacterized protein n=1 Tax=Favolaschia claudopus TaxID=2862362 RepID=A0AAW0BCE8_9AGAR